MIIASINGQSTSPLPQRPFGRALMGERDVFGRIQDVFRHIDGLTRGHVVQPHHGLGRCLFRSQCGQLAIYESVAEE